jgi:hypothetical protein
MSKLQWEKARYYNSGRPDCMPSVERMNSDLKQARNLYNNVKKLTMLLYDDTISFSKEDRDFTFKFWNKLKFHKRDIYTEDRTRMSLLIRSVKHLMHN